MPKRKCVSDDSEGVGTAVLAIRNRRSLKQNSIVGEVEKLAVGGKKIKLGVNGMADPVISKKVARLVKMEKSQPQGVEFDSNPPRNDKIVGTSAQDQQPAKSKKLSTTRGFQLTKEMVLIREKVEIAAGNSRKRLGYHVSAAGGLENAVYEAASTGCRSFAMFTRSQRTWKVTELLDTTVEKFKEACKKFNYPPDMIVPHGSYLMNCGSPSAETLEKSRLVLCTEVKNCQRLGIKYYNFHPGSTCGKLKEHESIALIAQSINQAMQSAREVVILIENMSCQGHTIGGKFEELRDIINLVDDKTRIGVCFDTCHAFAAGYDIKSEEGYRETISAFDKIVGLDYLKAIHFNDSMHELGAHKDRHANVGTGQLGLAGMAHFMRDPRWNGIPMVLETPEGDYVSEMVTLYGEDMCGGE